MTGPSLLLIAVLSMIDTIALADLPETPGRLVSVGTHRLHIRCVGNSTDNRPTVVLEAGLGGNALEWDRVQRDLGRTLRVCSYDRAGYGWSDPGPIARDSARAAKELFVLLTESGIPGPYLLVGHSIGGYSTQLFARYYPQRVAGLVLVDASHPHQIERFSADLGINIAPKGKLMFLAPLAVPDGMPADLKPLAERLLTYQARIAVTQELQSFRLSARQLAQADPLPNIPLAVISRGVQRWPSDERGNRMEALWQQLQTELVNLTGVGVQVIARTSGHHVHLDQPELVSQVIRAVAEAARYPQSRRQQRQALGAGLDETRLRFADTASIRSPALEQPALVMQ